MNTKTRFVYLAVVILLCASSAFATDNAKPNVVIIFLDDSGYADFQPFGDPEYDTPNVRRLAAEGRTFTQFHVPQAICSASRSALMTGSYPGRTGVFGAHGPRRRGLDPKFQTMGEVLKPQGYATAVFGKWHLGDQPDTRPHVRGFDESCGLMYSNDMWEFHPQHPDSYKKYPLQFWENGEVSIERVTPKEQTMLTTWYTEHAVDFIDRHKDEPFFVYLPHSMPHVPIFCSEKFEGKSGKGLYADVMMEIDWSVGEVMKALKRNGVEDNTLVIFTSDNGPWTSYGNHSGATPFREAKATGFDGGLRSACIMKFPGHIEAGTTSGEAFSSLDILPTIAHLASAATAPEVDGKNMWRLITTGEYPEDVHDYYPFSTGKIFEGVISGGGRWKLHLPHGYRVLVTPGMDGAAGQYTREKIGLSLFDMKNDPFETTNVIEQFPDVAEKLKGYADQHQQKFFPEQEN